MVTGYRALPEKVIHPKNYVIYNSEEFNNINKVKMEEAQPICENHEGTIIWHNDEIGYIVQVKIKNKGDFYINSPCTVTPTFGMDVIDGMFAQDAEEYILEKEIGFHSNRLTVFNDNDHIETLSYLKSRGLDFTKDTKKHKKWWQF